MWMVQHRSDVHLRHPYRPVSAHRIGAQQRVAMRAANQTLARCTSRGMARASTPPRGHKCGARRVGISLVSPWRRLGLIAGHGKGGSASGEGVLRGVGRRAHHRCFVRRTREGRPFPPALPYHVASAAAGRTGYRRKAVLMST